MTPAPFPGSQENSLTVIRDANGRVVSFTAEAVRIVAAIRLIHELSAENLASFTVDKWAAFIKRANAVQEIAP